jgi:tRNA pseudouridine55 synthase
MDGVLVIDKPGGLTSHDVVAAARRAIGERRIGHTGTLDPLATGVLPLTIGRATRLQRFLMASDKDYEATIVFGFTTDSYDVTGSETSRTGQAPSRERLNDALSRLTGSYLQVPPAYSAKKVEGRRAYALAREDEPVRLTAAPVSVTRVEVVDFSGSRLKVAMTCSAGFYVRSFAHALGELTHTGACLEELTRTRSGEFRIDEAISLAHLEDAAEMVIPMERLLPGLPAVTVTSEGLIRVSCGRRVEPSHLAGAGSPAAAELVRVFDPGGALVALATPGNPPNSLHPSVVLI